MFFEMKLRQQAFQFRNRTVFMGKFFKETHIFHDSKFFPQLYFLGHITYLLPEFLIIFSITELIYINFSARRPVQCCNYPEECRLPCAVFTDETNDFSSVRLQIEIFQNCIFSITLI